MDNVISVPACAKLNLFLEVTDKRPDGFHSIDSVFVEIDVADHLRLKPNRSGRLTLSCNRPDVPADETNLALRAAILLRQRSGLDATGLHIDLEKNIPSGGGLGGGSSDAAAVLTHANRLWGCDLPPEQLHALAAELGSDVAFFLTGGVCRCRGRGEIVAPLADFPAQMEFGLALPPIASSTAAAYGGLRLPGPGQCRSADAFVRALDSGDSGAFQDAAFNRFEKTVFAALPELGRLHAELEERLGCSVRMSGSGSSLWFIAPDGWRENKDVKTWAANNNVFMVSARAVPRSVRADASISFG